MKVKQASEKAALKLNIQKTKIMASSPITSWQTEGKKVETVILFSWAPKSLWTVTAAMKLEELAPWKKSYDKPAAAAAESLQSCPTLCDPIDSSPPGCPVPGILQARTLEWVAISFSNA